MKCLCINLPQCCKSRCVMRFIELNPAVMTTVQIYMASFVYFSSECSELHLFARQSAVIYNCDHLNNAKIMNANTEDCLIPATERNATQLQEQPSENFATDWHLNPESHFKLQNCILKQGLGLCALGGRSFLQNSLHSIQICLRAQQEHMFRRWVGILDMRSRSKYIPPFLSHAVLLCLQCIFRECGEIKLVLWSFICSQQQRAAQCRDQLERLHTTSVAVVSSPLFS